MATVKNYLIGERWEMVDLLDWAERFEKTPIEEHHLKAVASSDLMQDSGFDTIQASQELWAFLNLNLVGRPGPSLTKRHVSTALTYGVEWCVPWRPKAWRAVWTSTQTCTTQLGPKGLQISWRLSKPGRS